ncbi:MAG: sugar phosphate isomerase/epimerase family protein [bacterium]
MLGKNNFGACMPTFGSCADRYCLSGYGGGGTTMEEMLDLATTVEGLDGLELVGNWHVNDDNIHDVAKMFKDRNLQICMLVPDLWTQAKWGKGSLAAPDAKTRKAAVEEIKKVLDWAAELNCPYIDVWPGQDGYDYSFEADYIECWKWMVDGLQQCADHNSKVRMLVEYKPREPRTHCFVDHVGTVLLMLKDMDSVGVLLDVGHSMQGQENIAYSAALLHEYGKLDYLHLNDNYADWDDDMMVGAVHLPAYLEFVYWLKKVKYKGWMTLDIFPYREDGVKAAMECKNWMEGFMAAIDKVGMAEIKKVIKSADATKASAMMRQMVGMG